MQRTNHLPREWVSTLFIILFAVVAVGCNGYSVAAPMSPELLALSAELRETPRVATDGDFLLAVKDGKVYGWGTNTAVLISEDGSLPSWDKPVIIPIPNKAVISSVAAGRWHAVALDTEGKVWIWGNNKWGALGVEEEKSIWSPRIVGGLPAVTSISAGGGNTLVLAKNGSVWAWGSNSSGQAAKEMAHKVVEPHKVNNLPVAIAVYATTSRSFVITESHNLYMWGAISDPITHIVSQSYVNNIPSKIDAPCDVTNIDSLTSIVIVCSDKRVMVIGNSGSELGMGASRKVKALTYNPYLSNILKITGQTGTRLALADNGHVYGWGDNAYGIPELTNSFEKLKPVKVKTKKRIIDISSKGFSAFLITIDGQVLRWRTEENRLISGLYYFFGRHYFEPLKDNDGEDFSMFDKKTLQGEGNEQL